MKINRRLIPNTQYLVTFESVSQIATADSVFIKSKSIEDRRSTPELFGHVHNDSFYCFDFHLFLFLSLSSRSRTPSVINLYLELHWKQFSFCFSYFFALNITIF